MTDLSVLAVPLPTGDPAGIRSTARSLDSTGERLAGLGRRGVAVLDADWAGAAAQAAADRTARLTMRLLTEPEERDLDEGQLREIVRTQLRRLDEA